MLCDMLQICASGDTHDPRAHTIQIAVCLLCARHAKVFKQTGVLRAHLGVPPMACIL